MSFFLLDWHTEGAGVDVAPGGFIQTYDGGDPEVTRCITPKVPELAVGYTEAWVVVTATAAGLHRLHGVAGVWGPLRNGAPAAQRGLDEQDILVFRKEG